tara:strand:- start:324 stop:713 length:390 start_codon:yes stop_codon:yes gene_type:complete
MNITKIENRIKEINNIFNKNLNHKNNNGYKLLIERNELEFKRNKQNINFRLTCNNKYYYANQCYKFTKHILENGFDNINKDEIKKHGISFNKYSINNGYSQYHNDLKRFNNKDELLGFVIGYNTANNIA